MKTSAAAAIGIRQDGEWDIRERVIRRRVRGFADRWHRPTDCKAHDVFEGDHPAVDDGQAGDDATGLDPLAVVAAEAGATRIVQREPQRPIEGNVLRARPEGDAPETSPF